MDSNTIQHRRNRTRIVLAIAAAAGSVLALVVGFLMLLTGMPHVSPHTGDGTFRNVSWRFPGQSIGLPVTGYSIHFPRFELGQNFDATYQFADLPDLGKPAVVYLCIHDPAQNGGYMNREVAVANFSFGLSVDRGATITDIDKPLSKLICTSEGGRDCWGFYDPEHSRFYPGQSSRYRLHVRYTPDPKLSGLQGFVFIRCGGSI